MILTTHIKIEGNKSTAKLIKSAGLPYVYKEMFDVPLQYFSKGSTKKVLRKCDDCGDEKEVRISSINLETSIHYCRKCASKNLLSGDKSSNYKARPCADCGKQVAKKEYMRCRECSDKVRGGENHYKWLEDRSTIATRSGSQMQKWRTEAMELKGCECSSCGTQERLIGHHIDSFDKNRDKGYDILNCAILCEECHKDFHIAYGYGNNTVDQYEEWILNKLEERVA